MTRTRQTLPAETGGTDITRFNALRRGRGLPPTVRANPLKSNVGTAADGADANRPLQSGPEKTGSNGWRARL
jgi:hypothetical protein